MSDQTDYRTVQYLVLKCSEASDWLTLWPGEKDGYWPVDVLAHLKITWHWGESGQSCAMPLEGYVSTDGPYTGLTKEQLLQCAYSPVWVRVRCTLLVAYWTSWVAMLAGAITLILVTPKCSVPEPLQWWQISPMYQVYSLSYQDGNSPPDGVGDIPGMCCCYNYVLSNFVGTLTLDKLAVA
jgi:hypothetical protein